MLNNIAMNDIKFWVERHFSGARPSDSARHLLCRSGRGYLKVHGFVVRVWPAHEYCLLAPHRCWTMRIPPLFPAVGQDWKLFRVSAEMYVSTILLCSYWSFKSCPATLQLCSTSRFSSSLTKSSVWGTPGYMCVCTALLCLVTSSIEKLKLSGNVYRVGVCDLLILQAAL